MATLLFHTGLGMLGSLLVNFVKTETEPISSSSGAINAHFKNV